MKSQLSHRPARRIVVGLLTLGVLAGCAAPLSPPTQPPAALPTSQVAAPTEVSIESTATAAPAPGEPTQPPDENILYRDDFTNKATGWAEEQFDNYFVGYHEPESYHIEIIGPNTKAPVVPEPSKASFGDATIEAQVFTYGAKTASEGDFRYGIVFRRSGDQWYGFAISQRSKKWYVLKNSPAELVVLKEGTEESIHNIDAADLLRVDARGSTFYFQINDRSVAEVTDPDYAAGAVGLYAESFDSPNTHIHFDTLTVRNFEVAREGPGQTVLYQDDFTNKATGWSERTFDNHFIGYHEPESYHIEISGPNTKAPIVPEPSKQSFGDATFELDVFTYTAKTASEGDFRYGLVFRRAGDQWYGFAISQRTKKWYVLKSTPSALTVLQDGTDEGIHDLDVADTLRVDAQGPNFFFYINGKFVTQVTDPDPNYYAGGEVGLYAESFDSPNTHIHFDRLAIKDLELSLTCSIVGGTVYVRSGPSKTFPQTGLLEDGDTVQAMGVSPNLWVQVMVGGSQEPGWVSYSDGYMSCTPDVENFPVVNP